MARLREQIQELDRRIVKLFERYGHMLHRVSLGGLFVWFGLMKPFGHDTTTSLLAHTVYWGEPDVIVPVLGWWEVAIGICLVYRPLEVRPESAGAVSGGVRRKIAVRNSQANWWIR